ncbi:MAG TPA: response regulator [Ktedonobacteraceae bacterium]|nr:response regulator [Ktedonobacteraceae bacterium]
MSSEQPEAIVGETRIQTILLVEDDEDIGEFIAQALKDETPYTVLHVTDGARALDAVNSVKPGLFILDYQLPGINGIELHDRLHAIKELETIPTLIVSANIPSRKDMQQRQIAFLKKPFDLNELFKTVEKLLPAQEL